MNINNIVLKFPKKCFTRIPNERNTNITPSDELNPEILELATKIEI